MGDPEKAARVADLRALLRRLERRGAAAAAEGDTDRSPLAFGPPEIDAALGGGLPLGCLHEVVSAEAEDAAATGFCAALLGRLAAAGGPVLWIGDGPYAPGCLAFGLDPGRVILVEAHRAADRLWAMEEGLRCAALAAVLCEPAGRVGLTASRRLQLAAEAGGVTGFLLHGRPSPGAGTAASGRPLPPAKRTGSSAAVTRWRVAAAPSAPAGTGPVARLPGRPRWRLELLRCRGGRTGDWLVEWRDETGDFALAAISCDGPAAAAGQLRSRAI